LNYNPLALVFLAADHGREGKGYQVGYGEELHTLGVSWNTYLFDRDGVNTAFLGGMHEPDLVEASDDRLAAIASEEFERVVGEPAAVIDVARLSPGYPAWDHSWWALKDLKLPPDVFLATNYTGRMGIPSRVREARELAEQFAESADERAGDLERRERETVADD
jgi:oxygen-dependent protoporphyrinogen oxidase